MYQLPSYNLSMYLWIFILHHYVFGLHLHFSACSMIQCLIYYHQRKVPIIIKYIIYLEGLDITNMSLNWWEIEIIQFFLDFCTNCVENISLFDKLSFNKTCDINSIKKLCWDWLGWFCGLSWCFFWGFLLIRLRTCNLECIWNILSVLLFDRYLDFWRDLIRWYIMALFGYLRLLVHAVEFL